MILKNSLNFSASLLKKAVIAQPHGCGPTVIPTKRYYSSVVLPTTALVARFRKHGLATNVLKIEQEDLPPIGDKGVLVKMIHAPIHPIDIDIITGKFTKLPALPAIGGTEGVGHVLAVGPKTTNVKVGDLVVPSTINFGTWRNYATCDESAVMSVPSEINGEQIKLEYLACLSIAPATAFRLLNDFVDLKEGDVIIQNAANGMVGLSVIQLAASKGVKSINVIRRSRPDYSRLVEMMKEYGAYLVVGEDYIRTPEFRGVISDLPKPKLALNSTGGPSATELARLLGPGGTLVNYGGTSLKPVTLPTRTFLFNNLTTTGFSLDKWYDQTGRKGREQLLHHLLQLVTEKKLRLWVERHPFEHFGEAVERAMHSSSRSRKVLLSF